MARSKTHTIVIPSTPELDRVLGFLNKDKKVKVSIGGLYLPGKKKVLGEVLLTITSVNPTPDSRTGH